MKPFQQIQMSDTSVEGVGHVSEVTGAVHRDGRHSTVAWVTSTLASESVHLAELEPSGAWTALGQWPGFRPSVARHDAQNALALISPHKGRLAPCLSRDGGDPRPLAEPGAYSQVTIATAHDRLWAAWSVWRGGTCFICVGWIDDDGVWQAVGERVGGWPALASGAGRLRMAWTDADGLHIADVEPSGLTAVQCVARMKQAEVPQLIGTDDARWWISWHAPVGDGVLRWAHAAAQTDDSRWLREDPPIGVDQLTEDREAATEDQGWEFPAIAVDYQGRLWLAGRSSQGFRLQMKTAHTQWSERCDVAHRGWSGRSRSGCLLQFGAGLHYLRGSAQGLMLGQLEVTQASATDALTAPDGPAAAPRGPARVSSARPSDGPLPLWGDIHQHSIDSDGLGTAEAVYIRARDVYGHDFTALTDHARFVRRDIGPVTWQHQCELADAFYDPGQFITLRAFEFTGARKPGPGHKCVYFGDAVPEQLPSGDSDALQALLKATGGIAIPHHVGWTGADAQHHDPSLQPVWEICSVHGSYERCDETSLPARPDVVLPDDFIDRALAAGLRFGFVGGTDSHGLRWHHGIARKADPWRCGLTAAFAEPTRESLLGALRARQCYATTGARILLRLQIDGAPMGSEIESRSAELELSVRPTTHLERVSVIAGREVVAVERGTAAEKLRLRLPETTHPTYCYVRVEQSDGEVAWSSPVFITPP
jgi:hypothetical protein